ncbi:MAG: EndoU domain-containing protein [Clostridia bacterium]|nr:EndoU domain-containing protein [Clostridia bacterium]
MNKNLNPTRTFRVTRAEAAEILGRQSGESRRLREEEERKRREEEERKRREEEERKRRAAEAQASAARLSESRPLALPDTFKIAQPGPLADRHTAQPQPNHPAPSPRVQLPQVPRVDGSRIPRPDIALPGLLRKPDDLFSIAQQVGSELFAAENAGRIAVANEVKAFTSSSELEAFLNERFRDNYSADAVHFRNLGGKIANQTATPAEQKEYELLHYQYAYGLESLQTLRETEAKQQLQDQTAQFAATRELGNVEVRAETGRQVDENPLNDGFFARAVSGTSSRVRHYATDEEKQLIDLHYNASVENGDAYVEWLDQNFLKERSRKAVAEAIIKFTEYIPLLGPVPTRYLVSAISSVEALVYDIYNLGAGVFGYDSETGYLEETYRQMLANSDSWLDEKILRWTHDYTADVTLALATLGHSPYFSAVVETLGGMGNAWQTAKSAGYGDGEAGAYSLAIGTMKLAVDVALDAPTPKIEANLLDAVDLIKTTPRAQNAFRILDELMADFTGSQRQRFYIDAFSPVLAEIAQHGPDAHQFWTPEILGESLLQQLEQRTLQLAIGEKGLPSVRAALNGTNVLPGVDKLLGNGIIESNSRFVLHDGTILTLANLMQMESQLLPVGWEMQRNNYPIHMITGVVTKNGISGAHNQQAFEQTIIDYGGTPTECILSRKEHPFMAGIYEIQYQLPKKGSNKGVSWIIPGEYRIVDTPKTVYDPKIYTDEEILHWGLEAMSEGISAGRINGRKIIGYARNGLMYWGWISKETGKITNFHPVLE